MEGYTRRHAQRLAARWRRRPGALGGAVSRQERIPVRRREPLRRGGLPADDGLFQSTIQTLRNLKPSEYPLAQPYRLKVVQATENTKLEDYAKNVPVEKYQKEELELLNGVYPNGKLQPGQLIKVVE